MKVLTLILLLTSTGVSQIRETVARVAATQAQLPWFWSPPLEGFYEISYTFESHNTYRVLDARGKDKRQTLKLHLERTAVLGGIFNRCVAQNGASPCSPEMLRVYQQSNGKSGAFPPEQLASVGQHRREFWSEFAQAFHFEQVGTDGFRFRPNGAYKPRPASKIEFFSCIKGDVRFDPRSYEVIAFEYEVLKDVAILGRLLPKTTKYSVRLTKSIDSHYLPELLSFDTPRGKDRVVEQNEYSKYRRFAVDSNIQFGDPPKLP